MTLDEVIKLTNRRVNAIEYVIIPKIANTVQYIIDELDELGICFSFSSLACFLFSFFLFLSFPVLLCIFPFFSIFSFPRFAFCI